MSSAMDPFGQALLDYQCGFKPKIIFEIKGRDPVDSDVGFYFEEQEKFEELLNCAQGKILDIGAGAGKHSLILQKRGFDVTAIDLAYQACQVAKKRGVKKVICMDFLYLGFLNKKFDTVLLMFNTIASAGSVKNIVKLLCRLHEITTDQSQIILSVRDPSAGGPWPIGQAIARIRYKNIIGNWFQMINLLPMHLAKIFKKTGWQIIKTQQNKDLYGVVLQKTF